MFIAVRTGLEPVTPCVTGMYSNQLNYFSLVAFSLDCGCKGTTIFQFCNTFRQFFFIKIITY